MKKLLLFVLVVGVGYATIAQQSYNFKVASKALKAPEKPAIGIEPLNSVSITKSEIEQKSMTPPGDRNADAIVTIIDIGTSANAYGYGYGGGQKNLLHAEPMLEGGTVTNFHRMGGSLDPDGYSGDLGYDISTNGGTEWTNMIELYVATENAGGEYFTDAARYPNHGIWNPSNTLEDAYVVFFAPNLDQSNSPDSWGGYSYGIANIADTSVHTKNLLSSHGDYYQYIPDAYDMTAAGMSIAVDINQDWSSGSLVYQGDLIINRGSYDETAEDFVYTQYLLDFPIVNEADQARPAFADVAFGPDGQTGYIVCIADNGEGAQVSGETGYYPIFMKTTDGGETWGDPVAISISGADGLGGIVYHQLSDEIIAEIYEAPVPDREDISYTTAFDCDIAVDKDNNLHIAVIIGLTSSGTAYSISSFEDPAINIQVMFATDIFTDDGGTTFYAEKMGGQRILRGDYPDDTFTEDTRIQITTNYDRDRIFISWLDTDTPDAVSNNTPNIWCRGFNPYSYMKTGDFEGGDAPYNVTLFSLGMWNSHFAAVAQMALEPEEDKYVIPMCYEPNVTDPAVAVQFQYITDFSFSEADFTITGVDDGIEASNKISEVSQNYPNPFNGQTYVNVSLTEGVNLSLEVYTLTGQLVSSNQYGYTPQGTRTLSINGSNLASGVYFYTVTAGDNKVTHKMIVE